MLNDVLEDPHGTHDVPVLPEQGDRSLQALSPGSPATPQGVILGQDNQQGWQGGGVTMTPTPPSARHLLAHVWELPRVTMLSLSLSIFCEGTAQGLVGIALVPRGGDTLSLLRCF